MKRVDATRAFSPTAQLRALHERRRAGSLVVVAVATLSVAVPSGAATLYGLVNTGEIFVSPPDSLSWTVLTTLPVVDAIAMKARWNTSDFYLVTRSGLIYRSTDAGRSWSRGGSVGATDVVDLQIRPDGKIIVLTESGGVHGSDDAGASFSLLLDLPPLANNFARFWTTGQVDSKVYALGHSGGMYEFDFQGSPRAIWVPETSDAVGVVARADTLFVLTEAGHIARSHDGGANWVWFTGLDQVGQKGFTTDGSLLVAASIQGHVSTSPDGEFWTHRGSMNQLTLNALTNDVPSVASDASFGAVSVALAAAVPNPAIGGRGGFAIRLLREEAVTLELFDVRGRVVARRIAQHLGPGVHWIEWDTGIRNSGRYFVRLNAGGVRSPAHAWVILR